MLNLNELYAKITANFWESAQITAWVERYFFRKKSHKQTRTGASDAALPVILNGDGYVDSTFINGTDHAEFIADTVGAMVTGNTETGITVTYQDGDNTIDFVVDTEFIADTVGAMVAGNTETGITVTYQDADNTIDFVVDTEFIADTVGAMVTSNTESNITVTYQDADNTLDFSIDDVYVLNTGDTIAGTLIISADPATLQLTGDANGADELLSAIRTHNAQNATDPVAAIEIYRDDTNTNGYMVFRTRNGSSPAERMRINRSGNVGIGSTAPQVPLHVGPGTDVPSHTLANILGYFTQGSSSAVVARNSSANIEAILLAGGSAAGFGSSTNHSVVILVNGSTVATFNSSGILTLSGINVGEDDLTVFDEDTWTPTLVDPGSTFTYSDQQGRWQRRNNALDIHGTLRIATISPTAGNVSFTMPIANTMAEIQMLGCIWYDASITTYYSTALLVQAGNTLAYIINPATGQPVQATELAVNDIIIVNGTIWLA